MEKKKLNIISEYVKEEIKLSSSIFISHIEPCKNIEEVKDFISNISELYKDATHNCWAYVVGKNAEFFHSSDDGEPSGTAGKPILNTLNKYNLTNVAAVVTRYYGGTKLGVRGLIDAYSEITEKAILNTKIEELIEKSKYTLEVNYDFLEILKHKLKTLNAEIIKTEYTDKVFLELTIEKILENELENYLNEIRTIKIIDKKIL